eukprot:241698_1
MSDFIPFEMMEFDESKIMDEILSSDQFALPSIMPAPQLPPIPQYESEKILTSPLFENVQNPNHRIPNIQTLTTNKQFITPSSSYNSLASLNTQNTQNTVNTNTTNTSHSQSMATSTVEYDEYIGFNTKISQFCVECDIKLQLKDYVFISKDCTRRLGEYIVKE